MYLLFAGAFEVVLRLPTCLDNAMVTRESEVLLLSLENYDRLFNRKYAHGTVQKLKERMKMRLYLYIHRAEMLHSALKSPFLKFLSFLLDDDNAVDDLKRSKRREREDKKGLLHDTGHGREDLKHGSREAKEMNNMLKMLDINPKTTQGRLPAMESSERVIREIEAGLNSWVERSRGSSPNPSLLEPPKTAIGHGRTRSFNGEKVYSFFFFVCLNDRLSLHFNTVNTYQVFVIYGSNQLLIQIRRILTENMSFIYFHMAKSILRLIFEHRWTKY